MQSKTPKTGIFIMMLIIFNLFIAATVHPFNPLGVLVMNVTAIAVAVTAFRLIQRSQGADSRATKL